MFTLKVATDGRNSVRSIVQLGPDAFGQGVEHFGDAQWLGLRISLKFLVLDAREDAAVEATIQDDALNRQDAIIDSVIHASGEKHGITPPVVPILSGEAAEQRG